MHILIRSLHDPLHDEVVRSVWVLRLWVWEGVEEAHVVGVREAHVVGVGWGKRGPCSGCGRGCERSMLWVWEGVEEAHVVGVGSLGVSKCVWVGERERENGSV